MPIGGDSVYFAGEFDGRDHSIKNLTQTQGARMGLFGLIEKAYLHDFTMEDVVFEVAANDARVGAIAGNLQYWNVLEDITIDGITIVANGNDGLIGSVAGYVWKSQLGNVDVKDVNVTINGTGNVFGGHTAYGRAHVWDANVTANNANWLDGTVQLIDNTNDGVDNPVEYVLQNYFVDCDVDGVTIAINGNGSEVGGFFGSDTYNSHSNYFVNCHVTELDVTVAEGTSQVVGGFIAWNNGTTAAGTVKGFDGCSASGTITGADGFYGGFAGQVGGRACSYSNATADVDITCTGTAGGFVGATQAYSTHKYTFTSCAAKGDVTGAVAGGFAGKLGLSGDGKSVFVDMTACTASGAVSATSVAGGLIGDVNTELPATNWNTVDSTGYLNLIGNTASTNVSGAAETAQVGALIGSLDGVANGDAKEGNKLSVVLMANTPVTGLNISEDTDPADIQILSAEAKIGVSYYETLADAVAAAKDGDTVILLTNATVDGVITISEDITIVGERKAITWADGYNGTIFNVENGADVTLKGFAINGGNAFTFYDDTTAVENDQNWYTRFVDVGEEDKAINDNVIVNAGNLKLDHVTIVNVTLASDGVNGKTSNTETGGYYLTYNDDLAIIKSNGGSVVLDNARIFGNAGMVLNAINTETQILRSGIEGNMGAGNKGGIIIANGGTMSIKDTSIDRNKAMARSATILGVINGAEVVFDGFSTMDNNKHIGVGSNTAGAMIVLEGASRFVMNGGSISNNIGGRAGAIASRWVGGSYGQHEDTSIVLNAGTIKGNTASNDSWNGASVFLRSPATIGEGMKIDGTIAVNAAPGALEITGGTFTGSLTVTDGLVAEITGGTFDYDPTEWVAEGYEATDNGNGTYSVTLAKLAKVEVELIPGVWGTSYITVENWADLVAALGENTNVPVKVTLLEDIELTDEGLTIAGTAKKVIDLNGHTITGMLVNYAELIVNDETQNGKIEGGPVAIDNYGALTVNGGFFTGEYGAIYNNELDSGKATVVIYGGEFTALGDWYATIENRYGVLTVNGGKIVATNRGGYAIVDTCGETTINGGEIVSADGIAVETYQGKIVIKDGSFVGKVIVENQEGNVTVYGGTLVSNTPEYYYGMTNANGGITVLYGGTYERDYATAEGTSVKIAEGYISVANGENFTVVRGSEKVLEIWDVDDLMTFAALANSGNDFSGWTVNLMANIDLEWADWMAITSYATFNGNDHTISHLTYVPTETGRMGFFQSVGGPVSNLTLDGIKATVPADGRFGGFARYLNAPITNVTVKNIEVTTTDTLAWVGGFTSYTAGGSTDNCHVENFTVDATAGADLIGGFIALTSNRQLYQNCTVKGFKVTVTDTHSSGCGVGGFVAQTQTGWNNPKFKNDTVTGIDIVASGLVDVGGFVAWPGAHTTVENSSTEGKIDVTGVTSDGCFAGGFFGDLGWNCDLGFMGHVVTDCTADVDIITKEAPAGGFVGSATNSNNNSMYATFNNCSASGDITAVEGATADIGGFFGDGDRGVYNDCSASGTVTNNGTGYAGQFGGALYDVTPKYDGRYPAGTRDYLVDEITLDGCYYTGVSDLKFIGNMADGVDVTIIECVATVTDADGNVTYYKTFDAALEAAKEGDTITLLKSVVISEDTTLDLTGKTLDGNGITPAFRVVDGATLTVKGGNFLNATGYLFILGASDGSSAGNVIIEDGSYEARITIASVTKGTLTVLGGEFKAAESSYGATYMLNCIDANYKDGSAVIVVKGGTFNKFNPANNAAEGVGTDYVPVEYMATADGDNYVVTEWNYEIWTKADLERLATIVNGGNTLKGVTVKLMADIDLYELDENGERVTFTPIGNHADNGVFEGTFDGQSHTIFNLYQNGWALGYEWGVYGSAGLFGEIKDATVKNLTLTGAEILVEGGDVGGITGSATGDCTFENITITDSVFATFNNGCGGIIAWSGAGNYTFKNIKIDSDVTLAGLWGSFDSSIGGIVGQAELGASYTFENVDIACRVDAYNDCTASYDYYNYRMCGMIMGRLEATTTIDGRNYPDTSKYDITCTNVTVTYDYWRDYHYCDPTPSDMNGGRGMRVEAGYAYDGLPADYDHSQCTTHHMALIPFDQLFGGDQYGVKGLPTYEGVTVIYPYYAAQIGDAKYVTLAEAIAAVQNGETITLLDDIDEDVTIKQVSGKSFTIDGAEKTYTGTITVDGSNRSTGAETLTIQNVKFVADTYGQSSITTVRNSQAHNITVDGCSFTGIGEAEKNCYGIYLMHAHNVIVKETTATKVFDLVYGNTAVTGFTAENVTVTDSTQGIVLSYVNSTATFKNVTMSNVDIGIAINNNAQGTVTIEDCTITAGRPIITQMANALNGLTLEMKGENTFNGTNGIWLNVLKTGAALTVDLSKATSLNINDITFVETYYGVFKTETENVYVIDKRVNGVAAIGNYVYTTLADAFAAAVDGDVITLLKDVTLSETVLTKTEGAITLDLGGYTITTKNEINPAIRVLTDLTVKNGTMDTEAYCFIVGGIVDDAAVAGNLTIESGSYTGTTSVVSVTKGTLTVLGGEFKAAESNYGATYMLNCIDANYKDGSAKIIVKGGTFYGFDPEHNAAEGAGTDFVANTHVSIDNGDGSYTVTNYIEWIKQQLLLGNNVVLEKDIVVDGSMIESIPAPTNGNGRYPNYGIFNVVGDYDVTFDLNGHSITYNGHKEFQWNGKTYNSCTAAHGLFFANDGAHLTIVGEGDVIVNGVASGVYSASPDTAITIQGGNWVNNVCAECGATNLFLYASHGGELYIEGGRFEQTLDSEGNSYLIVVHGGEYKNSVIDYAKTKIVVTGGTFVGMNPSKAQYFQQTADNTLVTGETVDTVPMGYRASIYGTIDGVDVYNVVELKATVEAGGITSYFPGIENVDNVQELANYYFLMQSAMGWILGYDYEPVLTLYADLTDEVVLGNNPSDDTEFTLPDTVTWTIVTNGFDTDLIKAGEGYVKIDNGDGTLTVTKILASITFEFLGETEYFTYPGYADGDVPIRSMNDLIDTYLIHAIDFLGFRPGDPTITLHSDIALDETFLIDAQMPLGGEYDYDLTLDLNGYTITSSVTPAIRIVDDLDVTVKNGTMDTDSYCFILGASDGSSAGNLTIESGSYTGTTSIVSVTKGTLTVLGGEFKAAESNYGATYMLNCIDANYKDGSAKIIVKGGTFYGFDPEHNAAEGAGTDFVPETHISVDNGDDTYTVINYIQWIKDQLLAGNDVVLDRDVIVNSDYTTSEDCLANGFGQYKNWGIFTVINGDVTFDLNGHNVTYTGHSENFCNKVAEALFYANNGAKLTIVDSSADKTGSVDVYGMATAVYSTGVGSVATVKGGTWNGYECPECGAFNIFLYASHGGELYIEDGYFSQNGLEDSSLGSILIVEHSGAVKNLDALVDYSQTKVEITGGTFVGMNPEQAVEGYQKTWSSIVWGNTNVVASGYKAIDNGDGSYTVKKCVVTIGSVEDLLAFGNAVTANTLYQGVKVAANPDVIVLLTADLNLTDSGFAPMGNGAANAFSGTFDGQGHTISNMTLSCNYYRGVGFFRSLGKGATIKNLTFVNADVNNGAATGANHFYGVVAGFSNNVTLDNVDIRDSKVTCKYAGSAMIGCLEGASTIKNCDIENVILNTTNIRGAVYGILGNSANGHSATLENNTVNNVVFIVDGEIKAIKETLKYNEWADGTEYTESMYVAQIGETKYTTLADAIAAAKDGDTVTLIGNVIRASTLVVDKDVTIDLNGYTVYGSEYIKSAPVFRVLAEVTVKNGAVDGRDGFSCYAFIVGNSDTAGSLTIVDGKYYGDVTAVSVTKGTLTIEGGYFEATEYNGAHEFTLNCIDANYKDGTASIVVKGGTFYKFDPENNAAEGAGTDFVPETHISVDNGDDTYTVINYIQWIKDQLLAGNDVTLDRDVVVNSDYTTSEDCQANGFGQYKNWGIFTVINGDVTFDLNGHNVTYTGHSENFCNKAVEALFYANNGAKLTIVDSSADKTGSVDIYGMATAVYSTGVGSVATVKGGTWNGYGCPECGAFGIFLYASHGGELYIEDGYFSQNGLEDSSLGSILIVEQSGAVKNPDALVDYSQTKVEITGGTFVGMDPEQAVEGYQKTWSSIVWGNTNVVAEGKMSYEVKENVWIIISADIVVKLETEGSDEVKFFSSIAEAMAEARLTAGNDTISLLKDHTESIVLVYDGTILNVEDKTLTANYLVVFKGGFLTGNAYDKDGAHGQVKIDKDHVVITEGSLPQGQGYILPVWNEDHYVFGLYGALTSDKNGKYGFKHNTEDDSIVLTFKVKATTDINNDFMKLKGYEDHGISVIVHVEWMRRDALVAQDYIYTDEMVQACADKNLYTFSIGVGTREDLRIVVQVVSDTGATLSSAEYVHNG